MTIDDVTAMANTALYLVIKTSAPILLVSLAVGLIISIFQTVTSIQEQTLTFVPKIICTFLAIAIFGHWILSEISNFMIELWSDFAIYVR